MMYRPPIAMLRTIAANIRLKHQNLRSSTNAYDKGNKQPRSTYRFQMIVICLTRVLV